MGFFIFLDGIPKYSGKHWTSEPYLLRSWLFYGEFPRRKKWNTILEKPISSYTYIPILGNFVTFLILSPKYEVKELKKKDFFIFFLPNFLFKFHIESSQYLGAIIFFFDGRYLLRRDINRVSRSISLKELYHCDIGTLTQKSRKF